MNILPLRRTVAQSYRFAIQHFPLLVRVGWLWFLLAYAAATLAPILAAKAGIPVLTHLGEIIMMVAGTAVLVAWHRAIAAQEGAPRTALFGWRETRYLGLGLAMLVAIYIPVIAMMAIKHLSPDDPQKVAISILAAVFLVIAVSINRLILVFPAVALGLRDFGLKRSWSLTAGNTWRLFMGVIACSAPPMVISAGLTAAAEMATGPGTGWWVGRPLEFMSAVAMFVQLAVVGGFLSFVFSHFVGSAALRADAPGQTSADAGSHTQPMAKSA
jgi:hypothetical protein